MQTVVTVIVGFGAAIFGGVIAAKATRKATGESIEEARGDAQERQLDDNWLRLHTVAYVISEAMENIVHSVHVPSEKAMVGERADSTQNIWGSR